MPTLRSGIVTTAVRLAGLPRVAVLAGPSGAGKTALQTAMISASGGCMRRLVTTTTRPPRDGETDGVDYHFVDHAAFEQLVAQGELLEHETIGQHRYGSTLAAVAAAGSRGYICLAVLGVEGAERYSLLHGQTLCQRLFVVDTPPEAIAVRLGRAFARTGRDPPDMVARLMALQPRRVCTNENPLVDEARELMQCVLASFREH